MIQNAFVPRDEGVFTFGNSRLTRKVQGPFTYTKQDNSFRTSGQLFREKP
jgi:hypothetical protein